MQTNAPPKATLSRFAIYLAAALAVTVPAIVLRLGGLRPNPLLDALLFGMAILAAGFMLS